MLEFNLSTVIYTIVNVIVLYLLLKKFLFNPVISMIESRQEEIEHNLTAAEDQRIKAEAILEEYEDKLKNAQDEAGRLIAQAKMRAEHEYQTVIKRAQSEVKRLTEETERQIENERQTMLAGVRKEVATLALLAAARVSAHGRSPEEDDALLEAFLSEAGESL